MFSAAISLSKDTKSPRSIDYIALANFLTWSLVPNISLRFFPEFLIASDLLKSF